MATDEEMNPMDVSIELVQLAFFPSHNAEQHVCVMHRSVHCLPLYSLSSCSLDPLDALMFSWQVQIPLKISTALVVLIELFYAAYVFPPLTSYAAYLDARSWRKRFRLSRNRWFHVFTGGQLVGRYTVGLVVVSVAVAIGFAFSLSTTVFPSTKKHVGATVDILSNFSIRADNDLTEATRICSAVMLNSTMVYRKPVLYRHSFREKGERSGNTRFDRLVGSKFVSCTGQRLGETLPSDRRSRETVQVHTECCEKCERQRQKMRLFITVFASAPDGTIMQRHICSTQSTALLRKAFSVLETNNSTVAQPYVHLYNDIIPGYIWKLSGHSEMREYVYRVDSGTRIGWSALLNVLLFIAIIPYAFEANRYRRRGIRRFHGLGERDIAMWWALGKGGHTKTRCQKFRIACAQLGCRELEENLDDAESEVFEQERISIMSVSAVEDNPDEIPMYKCPICGAADEIDSG